MLDTLLELYDPKEPILNILGAWRLRPQRLVYFHHGLREEEKALEQLRAALRNLGAKVRVSLERLDGMDCQALSRWVEAHEGELGQWGIEIAGGSDMMLFMAGVAHARWGCPVYTRRPGNRYFALPEGKLIEAEQKGFTVEQRLCLTGGRLERYGRLKPEDLTPRLITLAGLLLDMQKEHPRLWTQQTRCIQGAVSRMDKTSLTLTLTQEECKANKFSTTKGHLFRQMKRAGAFTEVNITPEAVALTFPNDLIRDCLCDYGVWLEIYMYGVIKASGMFDDVRVSAVVRWEEEKAVNELDVVATAGMGLVVCSCKTTTPDMEALAELNVIAEGFGSSYAVSLLACMPKGSDRMEGPAARGEELGIRLLDVRQYGREELIAYFTRLGKRLQGLE